MKKSIKVMILMLFSIVSIGVLVNSGPVQGLFLFAFAIGGMWLLEKREVKRTVEYLSPLLFRCGRDQYIEDGIALLKKRLLMPKYFNRQILCLEVGLYNVRGDYQQALERAKTVESAPWFNKDKRLYQEYLYALLKLGEELTLNASEDVGRQQLNYCLSLINNGQNEVARRALLAMREEECGNVIFREINSLLAQIYKPIDREESDYYQRIADAFY